MKRLVPVLVVLFATIASVLLAVGVNVGTGRLLALPEDAEMLPLDPAPEPGAKPPARPPRPVADAEADGPDGEPPDPLTPEPPVSRPRGLSKEAYLAAILRRNLFDSTKVGVEPEGDPDGPPGVVISDLQVQLVATIVADPAEFSSALILDNSSKSTVGYGIGDKLEDAEIVTIETRKVTIKRGNGAVEYLLMDSEKDDEKTSSSEPVTKSAGPADDATEGITKESETKYTVDRSLLDKYMGDIEGLSKMARAMPHKGTDGNTDGYRLSGIRRNSPLYALGIRNGDVIHNVNGTSLANPADAMGAFQSLGSTSNFNFDITRRNNPVTMEYAVK